MKLYIRDNDGGKLFIEVVECIVSDEKIIVFRSDNGERRKFSLTEMDVVELDNELIYAGEKYKKNDIFV